MGPDAFFAGAKAFEWKQDIGINQARRTGEVATLLKHSNSENLSGAILLLCF